MAEERQWYSYQNLTYWNKNILIHEWTGSLSQATDMAQRESARAYWTIPHPRLLMLRIAPWTCLQYSTCDTNRQHEWHVEHALALMFISNINLTPTMCTCKESVVADDVRCTVLFSTLMMMMMLAAPHLGIALRTAVRQGSSQHSPKESVRQLPSSSEDLESSTVLGRMSS